MPGQWWVGTCDEKACVAFQRQRGDLGSGAELCRDWGAFLAVPVVGGKHRSGVMAQL